MADLSVVSDEAESDDEPAERRQTQIPGTEAPCDPELDKLAIQYIKAREKRAELQTKEKELKVKMSDKLKALGVPKYKFIDGELERWISRDVKETIRVSLVDEDDE